MRTAILTVVLTYSSLAHSEEAATVAQQAEAQIEQQVDVEAAFDPFKLPANATADLKQKKEKLVAATKDLSMRQQQINDIIQKLDFASDETQVQQLQKLTSDYSMLMTEVERMEKLLLDEIITFDGE